MALQGISSSLNLTLARLNSIESNFQALNNIAFEIDLKEIQGTTSAQNSDFKTILDEKINSKENKVSESQKDDLVVYEDEKPQTPQEDSKIQDETLNSTSVSTESTQLQETKQENISLETEPFVPLEIKEIEKTPTLKSKISMKTKNPTIDEIIETFSNKYSVDSDFIKAIIKQESGFNPKATSKKGAMGLMQLMPKTAKSLGVNDAYNPFENIEGGVKHIKGLLNRYNNNEELALAAYNAGAGAVKKYGGIPPYKETQNYVKSIMATYTKAKEAKIW